jgi:hypothetical protein
MLKVKYNIKNRISSGKKINKKSLKRIFYNSPFKLINSYQSIDKKIILKKNNFFFQNFFNIENFKIY